MLYFIIRNSEIVDAGPSGLGFRGFKGLKVFFWFRV